MKRNRSIIDEESTKSFDVYSTIFIPGTPQGHP